MTRSMMGSRGARRAHPVWSALLLGLGAAGAVQAPPVEAAGPWQARVVDAETREPLEGVAVLAVWHRWAAGHPGIELGRTGYYASTEAVTNADGRFTLPARSLVVLGIGLRIQGPELALFKAGYGGWRFRGPDAELTGAGALIEMRPLRTSEARIQYLDGRGRRAESDQLRREWRHADSPANPVDIPYARAAGYEAAINAEREASGLPPIGIGYPFLWNKDAETRAPVGTDQPALRGASGVAFDATGHLYVADTHHHRIVKLSPAREVVAAWGRFGRGDGQFQFPRGVAVGRDGTVYVADWGNHRVQRFSPEGRFLGAWGALRFDELGGTFSPTDLAVTRVGEVVVFADHRVWRFTPAGRLLGVWGGPFQFATRSGIAVDPEGHVVGITGHRPLEGPPILRFDRTGAPLTTWGQRGRGPGQLFDPIALAVDETGRVYVADADPLNPRVVVFDARGTVLHQWDAQSGSAAGLRFPSGLAVDRRGTVYVTDSESPRLHTLGPVPTR